jgi:deoxyribose-phosphate aldolase
MQDVARLIDHTLLSADATAADIMRLCKEAAGYGFHSVCVNPYFVEGAKGFLEGTDVSVVTVVGFTRGMNQTEAKAYEAERCAISGADELDIVINIGAARDGLWDAVEEDLSAVVSATPGVVHKAIIETCYLGEDEKRAAVKAVLAAGAEFVKTSTGYGPGGATVEDVRLIGSIVGGRAGIKAAGGIRTLGQVRDMVEAGATRIGTSSGVGIMQER